MLDRAAILLLLPTVRAAAMRRPRVPAATTATGRLTHRGPGRALPAVEGIHWALGSDSPDRGAVSAGRRPRGVPLGTPRREVTRACLRDLDAEKAEQHVEAGQWTRALRPISPAPMSATIAPLSSALWVAAPAKRAAQYP